MNAFNIISVLVVGYLLGAIPCAVLIARSRGVDIFKAGSGNPGATNVKRVLGKAPGNLCFALDFLKGLVAAGWPILGQFSPDYHANLAIETNLGILGLIAAILGHSYSVFIGFRGGKGISTTMGGLLALSAPVLICAILVWIAAFYSSRYVSVASLAFGISLPILGLIFHAPATLVLFLLLLTLLITWLHRANIQRLRNGTENRFAKTS